MEEGHVWERNGGGVQWKEMDKLYGWEKRFETFPGVQVSKLNFGDDRTLPMIPWNSEYYYIYMQIRTNTREWL